MDDLVTVYTSSFAGTHTKFTRSDKQIRHNQRWELSFTKTCGQNDKSDRGIRYTLLTSFCNTHAARLLCDFDDNEN